MLKKPFVGEFKVGQRFGENFNSYYQSEGLKGHGGLDFPMPNGTPIVSPCNGQVILISTDIQRGEGVNVLTDDTYIVDGQNVRLACIMWHMKDGSIKVKVGDHVTTGQLLGLSNNTGQTTGPHLHFGIFPLIVSPDGGRKVLNENNGYKGAIDPLPFLDLGTDTLIEISHTWKRTKQQIKDFQVKHGLTPDGIVGPKTHAEIEKLI